MERKNFIICLIYVVTMVTDLTDASRDDQLGNKGSPEERARHHFIELKAALQEMPAIKNGGGFDFLTSILATSGSDSNPKDNALSKLILNALTSNLCNSIYNVGDGSSTNINIYNNSTVNISTKSKKDKKDKDKKKKKGKKWGEGEDEDGADKPSPTDSSGYSVVSPGEDTSSTLSLVHPIKATATRQGQNSVKVTFKVARSDTAIASHIWTADGSKTTLKGPQEYGLGVDEMVSSDVDFVFNTSECQLIGKYDDLSTKREQFTFKQDGGPVFEVGVTIHTCIFEAHALDDGDDDDDDDDDDSTERVRDDHFEGEPEDVGSNRGLDDLVLSQPLSYPKFWDDVDVENLATPTGSASNVSFTLDIALGKDDLLMLFGFFFDPLNDKMNLSQMIMISTDYDKLNVRMQPQPQQSPTFRNVMSCQVERQTRVNTSVPGMESLMELTTDDDGRRSREHISATIKITVSLPNDKSSGKIHLQHEMRFRPEKKKRNLVSAVTVRKVVNVKPAENKHTFPLGKWFVHTHKSFVCRDDQRSIVDQGFGINCRVFCQASGRGIKSVRIKRIRGGVDPVKKYMEVDREYGYVFAELGPSRKAVDGLYQCRAVGYKGTSLKWRISVRTWGFPQVTNYNLSVSGLSATFVCAGNATRQPIEVRVFLREGVRLDNNPSFVRRVVQNDQETEMSLTFPSSHLKYPTNGIYCSVSNVAGEDIESVFISTYDYPDYYRKTDHPYILKNESGVTDHGNGSTTLKCTATGKQPLSIDFYLDDRYSEDARIKNVPEPTRRYTPNGNETAVTVTVPTMTFNWPVSWIYCIAKNDLGEASLEYNVLDVIDGY